MKNKELTPTNPTTYFTVTKNDINNYNALIPSVLYETMQQFVTKIIANNADLDSTPPKLYKLEILKNAFLNETLIITSQLKKLNEFELQLLVIVKQNENKSAAIICKAIFKTQFNDKLLKAS